MPRVLFVEDDESLRLTQSLYLKREGFQVVSAQDHDHAGRELARQSFDVVITDLRLGMQDGMDVVRDARRLQPTAEVLVITGYGSVDTAVEAMKEGAYDYLTKPVDPEHLVRVLHKAIERKKLRRQISHLQDQFAREAGLNHVVAVSQAMRDVLQTVDQVAQSEATVLIEGESGTGKELIARLIHQRSSRATGPFLGINCGAMPEALLESELFGHKRGAFTGAHRDHKGLFEAADGGTLLLDEVAEISQGFQVKLLRALQERTIRRIGESREIAVDVRIMAASNSDLARMVRDGRFRQDLFFRIKVVPLYLPPLRKRPEDIVPLAENFLMRLGNRMGRRTPRLTEAARRRLLDYDWPGNVRELENTVERALIFNKGEQIGSEDLMLESCLAARPEGSPDAQAWRISLSELERRHVMEVLSRCGQNKVKAAQILGIGYNTLWRKLKQWSEQ